MKITNLSITQQQEALQAFRDAVLHRARQWDAERCLETIIGKDVNISIEAYAFTIDDANRADAADHLTLEHLAIAIS